MLAQVESSSCQVFEEGPVVTTVFDIGASETLTFLTTGRGFGIWQSEPRRLQSSYQSRR